MQTPTQEHTETETLTCPVTGEEFDKADGIKKEGILYHPDIEDSHTWIAGRDEWVGIYDVVHCEDGSVQHQDDAVCVGPNDHWYPEGSSLVVFAEDERRDWERDCCSRWDGSYYTDTWLEAETFVCDSCGVR